MCGVWVCGVRCVGVWSTVCESVGVGVWVRVWVFFFFFFGFFVFRKFFEIEKIQKYSKD